MSDPVHTDRLAVHRFHFLFDHAHRKARLTAGDMPGRLFITEGREVLSAFAGVPLHRGPTLPDLDIAPGQDLWVLAEDATPHVMRWGMILAGKSKGRRRPLMDTVINARSETVFKKEAFAGLKRALVPAHGWYEWTGPARKKTRWRFAHKHKIPLMFAAVYNVWEGPGGIAVPQFATLTCEPNDLVRPIHHRMGVILEPAAWRPYLAGDDVPMDPAKGGDLVLSEVDGMDH